MHIIFQLFSQTLPPPPLTHSIVFVTHHSTSRSMEESKEMMGVTGTEGLCSEALSHVLETKGIAMMTW